MLGRANLRILRWMAAFAAILAFASFTTLHGDETPDESPRQKEFPGGVALNPDAELVELLDRAKEFVADDRHNLAAVLFNRIMVEDGGGVLVTRPGDIYELAGPFPRIYRRHHPLDGHITAFIADNENLRKTYQTQYDDTAQVLLSGKQGRRLEQAQAQLLRSHFFTSVADEAALALAQTRLARGEYSAARRILAALIEDYPKPDIDLDHAKKLFAAAAAGVVNPDAGRKQIKELLGKVVDESKPAAPWPMAYGRPDRAGSLPALPKEAVDKPLSPVWTADTLPTPRRANVPNSLRPFYPPQDEIWPEVRIDAPSPARQVLLEMWTSKRWQPVAGLLVADGRIFYKADGRVNGRDADTGELLWAGRTHLPPISHTASQHWGSRGDDRPTEPQEIAYFGDRVPAAMAVAGGRLFSLEGDLNEHVEPEIALRFAALVAPTSPFRHGYIRAYDAANGKFQWERTVGAPPRKDVDAEKLDREGSRLDGFLGPPTPYLDWILVPAGEDGALWLYALAQDDGKIVWKRRLGDVRTVTANPWSSPAVAVAGGDAYVATGAGAVFALDALTGDVHWAVQYQRNIKEEKVLRVFGREEVELKFSPGWDEDFIFVHGEEVIVLPSDADVIVALVRNDGKFRWESPRSPEGENAGRYALGVAGSSLFVAGDEVVRGYSLKRQGRLEWETLIESVHARGALTADAIYLPGEGEIVRLDLKTGRRTGEIKVALPHETPLGNLFSDGRRLISAGPWHLHVLGDLADALAILEKRVAAGDAGARWHRLRVLASAGNTADAVADLEGIFAALVKDAPSTAHAELVRGINELQLDENDPLRTLAIIARAEEQLRAAKLSDDDQETIAAQRDAVLTTALNAVSEHKPDGAAAALLQAAPLFSPPYVQQRAAAAMEAAAGKGDLQPLRAALKSNEPSARALAAAAVARLVDDPAAELAPLLTDDAERVRLAAAAGLAAQGQRAALAPLVEMLSSDDLRSRAESAKLLRGMTGQDFDFATYASEETRAVAIQRWQAWLAEHGKTAELKPAPAEQPLLGRTLICYYSQNKVIELDKDGNEVWSATVPYAWGCQGLGNGHRVVASYSGRYVVEYDEEGKEVWKSARLPGSPFGVQRLDDGNTLVACSDSDKVIEVAPDKSIAWEHEIAGRPMDARRLENGNTLISLQTHGKVVEVDRDGKVVWQLEGVGISASRLENGNTLIARQNHNKVEEVTPRGEVVWAVRDLRNPYDAQRLPGGNTLIVDYRGVREYNPNGEVVWERKGQGASRVHRY